MASAVCVSYRDTRILGGSDVVTRRRWGEERVTAAARSSLGRCGFTVKDDFMAFTAQTFRRVLGRKPSSPANLQAIRDIMIENLSTMKAHFDNDTMPVILDIFKVE